MGALVICASLMVPAVARADDDDQRLKCAEISEYAQRLRKEGKYVEALGALNMCARASCPALVQRDCSQWREEVQAASPSVVLGAKDETGNDVVDVRVLIDGTPVADSLDGRAIQVNPGIHTFRFERARSVPIEWKILIREGEKRRPLTPKFADDDHSAPTPPLVATQPATPTSAEPASRARRARDDDESGSSAPWILLGAGVAMVLGGLVLYAVEDNEIDVAEDKCKNNYCSADTSSYRAKRTVGVVTAMIGGGLTVAGLVWLVSRDRGKDTSLRLTPAIGHREGGLNLAGTF